MLEDHALTPELTPEQIEQKYQKLRAAHDAGYLSWPHFVEQVQGLRGQDAAGSWWMINPDDGVILRVARPIYELELF